MREYDDVHTAARTCPDTVARSMSQRIESGVKTVGAVFTESSLLVCVLQTKIVSTCKQKTKTGKNSNSSPQIIDRPGEEVTCRLYGGTSSVCLCFYTTNTDQCRDLRAWETVQTYLAHLFGVYRSGNTDLAYSTVHQVWAYTDGVHHPF